MYRPLSTFILLTVLAIGCTVILPFSVTAGPLDSYFIRGTWVFEETLDGRTTTTTYVFDSDGRGSTRIDYSGGDYTGDEFDWKIEDGALLIRSDQWDQVADTGDTPELDPGWVSIEYNFDRVYTKLKLKFGGEEEVVFDKSGSIAGVCCPACCSNLIGVPVLLSIGFFIRRRN